MHTFVYYNPFISKTFFTDKILEPHLTQPRKLSSYIKALLLCRDRIKMKKATCIYIYVSEKKIMVVCVTSDSQKVLINHVL